jgi:hypothetical protein
MSTFLDLPEGTSPVVVVAARLATLGQSLHAAVAGLPEQITALEAQAPWGSDSYGVDPKEGFLASYHGAGEEPFNESLKADLRVAGTGLANLGNAMVSAMADFLGEDATSSAEIGRL